MGLHANTVFKNSCLKVPLDPSSRLPSAKFERNSNLKLNKKSSVESVSSDLIDDTKNQLSFREFYKSIPDYEEVTHMSNREFYLHIERLRENKNRLLMKCGKLLDNEGYAQDSNYKNDKSQLKKYISTGSTTPSYCRTNMCNDTIFEKLDYQNRYKKNSKTDISDLDSIFSLNNGLSDELKGTETSLNINKNNLNSQYKTDFDPTLNSLKKDNLRNNKKTYSPKFSEKLIKDDSSILKEKYSNIYDNPYIKSYSLPSSPVKRRKFDLDSTTPKPFKMTERDEEKQMFSKLKEYTKELENDILKDKTEFKQFRANPVPIESRIPLFDKIMEDQELRRSICKLQSTAELQAQMKPFSFTEREERRNNLANCYRLCRSNPQLTISSPVTSDSNNKRFRAKPVPKNLFSNYIYDKMREDDFYRALNRRIRAEEMLKASSLPPSMAKRDKYRKDITDSPILSDNLICNNTLSDSNSSGRMKKRRNKKKSRCNSAKEEILHREYNELKREFINSGSPRKNNSSSQKEYLKKAYGNLSSTTPSSGYRVQSASECPSVNRSNLAAVLRIESTKRKMEADVLKILEEERYQSEVKWRDSVLRRKPAWNSLKHSHSDDLAMRLQTRRDEERLRREQFLHQMELMYGRVHQQPLMFERMYGPKRYVHKREKDMFSEDNMSRSKPRSALLNRDNLISNMSSPNRSRKVSINETAETIGDAIDDMIYRSSDDDKDSKSSDIPESIDNI